MEKKKPLIVNLFGSAGSGKSTTARHLTSELVYAGVNACYVDEYAKHLVIRGNSHLLKHQGTVFYKQHENIINHIEMGYDVLVTDSPLFLSGFYGLKYNTASKELLNIIFETYNSYDNINYFLERTFHYENVGRVQDEKESDDDSKELIDLLHKYRIVCEPVKSRRSTSPYILHKLLDKLGV